MANYCSNMLNIKGDVVSIEEFYAENLIQKNNDEKTLIFSNVSPEPEYENKEDWYAWRNENWGTKWEPETYNVGVAEDKSYMYIDFETAWSPPIQWLEKATIKYPNLTFTLDYREDGMGFKGKAKASKGVLSNKVKEIN